MPPPILIIKNISHEGGGLLEDILKERDLEYKVVDLHQGATFPDPSGYSAVVVCGGPDSANDTNDKMTQELAQIRKALDLGMPYIGICLGLQTLVKAAGGAVLKSPLKEIGFKDPNGDDFTIELTEAGKSDALFAGLDDSFKVLQLHGETVDITPEMRLLGTGKHVANQVVKVGGNAYGLQCHFEVTPTMFEDWLQKDPDLNAMDQAELQNQFQTIQAEYTKTGKTLFSNFLDIAGL